MHLQKHVAISVLASLLVSACTSVSTGSPSAATSASAVPGASASASAPSSASPSRFAGENAKVRLALDWTPNTDHTGFYVAEHEGWYDEAGIDLQILPYSSSPPETLLAAHQAECGISFQDSMTFAVALGAKITSVMAILQHAASEIAVLADSSITRPRELDGKTYAGFGYPNEEPTLKFVIKHDGGKGQFKTVTLESTAYEALYAKKADFTIPFTAWEGIEAQQRNIALRYFKFTDYGFPDFYQVVLACDNDWLAREPDAAKRFVGATVRGFGVAATDPDRAAQTLLDENPGVFDANPALPKASAEFLASGRFYVDAAGKVGTQTLDKWKGYSGFLYDQGLLVDGAGKPLTSPPDYSALFANDYLP